MHKTHAFSIHINLDHPCFEGHFPSYPVLPAVAQFSLLADALSDLHGQSMQITAMPTAKFLKPITPDITVSIELTLQDEHCSLFVIQSEGELFTKGRVHFRVQPS